MTTDPETRRPVPPVNDCGHSCCLSRGTFHAEHQDAPARCVPCARDEASDLRAERDLLDECVRFTVIALDAEKDYNAGCCEGDTLRRAWANVEAAHEALAEWRADRDAERDEPTTTAEITLTPADFKKIVAPFTPEQVDGLNRWQACGWVHPFTCGEDHPHPISLVATPDGWVCEGPPGLSRSYHGTCDYRQDWALAFMVEDPTPPPWATVESSSDAGPSFDAGPRCGHG